MIDLNSNPKYHTQRRMFFDGAVGIQRYDTMRYPIFDKLTRQQNGFHWLAHKIDCSKDAKDFKTIDKSGQHMFVSNIKRQIVLDTKQGRAPVEIFGPIASLPEVEAWLNTWQYFEGIHSRSYTHVLDGVFTEPSKIYDGIMDIPEIVACAEDISLYYDRLAAFNRGYQHGDVATYEHKKALWLALNSVNALEGVRFYVSFACSWAFAELKLMEGNAKIIKEIARDENIHLAGTQQMLKLLPLEDPDFAAIKVECAQEVVDIFVNVVKQEQVWADYLFIHGSMIGMNAEILKRYVEWIAHKRMIAIGAASPFTGGVNPLPWTQRWISGADVQVAPQEVEISQYTYDIARNVTPETFAAFDLG